SVLASTGFSPFELNYGHLPSLTHLVKHSELEYQGVDQFMHEAQYAVCIATDAIIEAHVDQAFHANKCRQALPVYEKGDLVFLSTRN
ncbi:hypothetical protein DACRYDRAFT_41951, partial [Dacryopinax primogenitus]